MAQDLMIRPLASRDAARLEHIPKGGNSVWCWLGGNMQGLLKLVEGKLQVGVSAGAVDLPMGVGRFADPGVVSLLDADSLFPATSIIDLLIINSRVFDHCFDKSMAKTGPIGGACFGNESSITVPGGIAYFRDLSEQNFTSGL